MFLCIVPYQYCEILAGFVTASFLLLFFVGCLGLPFSVLTIVFVHSYAWQGDTKIQLLYKIYKINELLCKIKKTKDSHANF